jgi:hypothetical protein|tara:strand:- start:54 stop:209 length:156 start_codon:yes stop_codon:yes gene_type:complete
MKNKVFKTKKNLKKSVKHFSNNSVDHKNIKKDISYRGTDFSRTIEAFSDCV